jgi:hypothetical protein
MSGINKIDVEMVTEKAGKSPVAGDAAPERRGNALNCLDQPYCNSCLRSKLTYHE